MPKPRFYLVNNRGWELSYPLSFMSADWPFCTISGRYYMRSSNELHILERELGANNIVLAIQLLHISDVEMVTIQDFQITIQLEDGVTWTRAHIDAVMSALLVERGISLEEYQRQVPSMICAGSGTTAETDPEGWARLYNTFR